MKAGVNPIGTRPERHRGKAVGLAGLWQAPKVKAAEAHLANLLDTPFKRFNIAASHIGNFPEGGKHAGFAGAQLRGSGFGSPCCMRGSCRTSERRAATGRAPLLFAEELGIAIELRNQSQGRGTLEARL